MPLAVKIQGCIFNGLGALASVRLAPDRRRRTAATSPPHSRTATAATAVIEEVSTGVKVANAASCCQAMLANEVMTRVARRSGDIDGDGDGATAGSQEPGHAKCGQTGL